MWNCNALVLNEEGSRRASTLAILEKDNRHWHTPYSQTSNIELVAPLSTLVRIDYLDFLSGFIPSLTLGFFLSSPQLYHTWLIRWIIPQHLYLINCTWPQKPCSRVSNDLNTPLAHHQYMIPFFEVILRSVFFTCTLTSEQHLDRTHLPWLSSPPCSAVQ